MILLHFFFAVGGGSDIFNDSKEASQKISEGWTPLWDSVISPESGIYAALCRVGILFALGALLVWSLNLIINYHRSGAFAIEETIWPVIVIFFLAQDGIFLAQTTLLMRDIINYTNQTFLENASASISLQEAHQEAMYHGVAATQIGALIKQCQAFTGQQQLDCLKQASVQAQEILQIYGLEDGVWDEFLERLKGAVNQGQSQGTLSTIFAPLNAVVGAANQAVARFILVSFQSSFQQALEGTLLLTSLLGPLAVGGSLLPAASRSIVAWMTGFMSVGMAKLCYNIMVGFSAVIVTEANPADNMAFLLTSAVLAPALSLALASGGGMAIWSALVQAQAGVVDATASAVSMVVFKKLL